MSDEPTTHDDENAAFVRKLFGWPEPEPELSANDAPPDFDGGPREPAPAPDDPVGDHDQLIAELFAPRDLGGGP